MINKKKISYWCPFIEHVATVKSTLNSIYSLKKFSPNRYEVSLINVFGEWNSYLKIIKRKKIFLVNILNPSNFLLNKQFSGFFWSRVKYFYIFFLSYFKLKKYLNLNKPDFLIIHLLTFIPLLLFFFNKFDTKLILRISGKPKLNFFRKFLWKNLHNKIYHVTCPTSETKKDLLKHKLFYNKLSVLRDPVICVEDIKNLNSTNIKINEDYFCLAVGRLTHQKNFSFLIKNFHNILKYDQNLNLIILGSGELKSKLMNLILKEKYENKIKIIDFNDNIFEYFKKCKFYIQCSLWEDPGFALIEASYFSKLSIASNCPSGPNEIIKHQETGILFKNNDEEDFETKINDFYQMLNDDSKKKRATYQLKLSLKKFTIFSHHKKLVNILSP